MIRKAIIVVLTLAALGTALLYADSYRLRLYPLTMELRRLMSCGMWTAPEELRIPGPRSRHYWDDDSMILDLWAHNGRFSVAYNSTIGPVAHVSNRRVSAAGFGYETGRRYWPRPDGTYAYYQEREITVPLAVIGTLFAAYPAIAFIRGPLRRWRRRRRGMCIRCGYDLQGNVSGTCPECGGAR